MKLEPLADRVVVQLAEAPSQSKGGIYIPEQGREKPQKGTVLAVGPGRRDERGFIQPVGVKVGDVVLFSVWAGSEIKELGENIRVINEADILGRVVEA